jgi:hypothetical protein
VLEVVYKNIKVRDPSMMHGIAVTHLYVPDGKVLKKAMRK